MRSAGQTSAFWAIPELQEVRDTEAILGLLLEAPGGRLRGVDPDRHHDGVVWGVSMTETADVLSSAPGVEETVS